MPLLSVQHSVPDCDEDTLAWQQGKALFCMRGWASLRAVLPRKEGRRYYICSSRLGLIRWCIIQHVKAVHDTVSDPSDVHLMNRCIMQAPG